jgi:hypothetical protein
VSLPKASELLKLAKACRKAGIVHFKSPEYEFTLGDEPVRKPTKTITQKQLIATSNQGEIETDSLSEDQILFWSSDPLTSDRGVE